MAAAINPITSSLTGAQNQTGTTNTSGGLGQTADMNTFLKLLVTQMQNQDPLNPTDSTQFVSQLAQFSELEQMIGVRTNTQAIDQDLQALIASAQKAAGVGQSGGGQ